MFRAISLCYRNAPISVRGLFTFDEKEAKQFMLRMKDFFQLTEVLVVSTCNRTEIYYSAEQDLNEDVIKLLLIEKEVSGVKNYLNYFERFSSNETAVRHLFEVSLGLHSQVVGDMQISNQVKKAYQWAVDLDLAGPFLHRLMHTIFFANKRVFQETSFRDGACSVSYAAVALVKSLLRNPKILIVGLGEIGVDVVKNMPEGAQITLTNRTKVKAEVLGAKYGHRVADFEDIDREIEAADVIISSIATDKPFFTKARLSQTGKYSFKYLIDLSVPVSVSPEVEDIPGVLLYDVDTLRSRTDETLTQRMDAIPQVKQIISEAMADFEGWSNQLVMLPAVQKFKQALDQIRKEELARSAKHLSPDELAALERITNSMVQKIVKQPALQLKTACQRGEPERLIEALQTLFNLEPEYALH